MVNECSCGCNGTSNKCMKNGNDSKPSSYMFFNNLQTIKRSIDLLSQMDESQVEQLLRNGHDWASDHIATAKDDVTEVAEFFMNELGSSRREEENPMFIETFESFVNKSR